MVQKSNSIIIAQTFISNRFIYFKNLRVEMGNVFKVPPTPYRRTVTSMGGWQIQRYDNQIIQKKNYYIMQVMQYKVASKYFSHDRYYTYGQTQ